MSITTKEDYLSALSKALGSVSEMDRMDALQYYREYFLEAGEENEARVIEELGAPKKLAAQIKAQSAIKEAKANPKNGRKGLRAVWMAMLAVFALPVGLPVAMALAITVIALLIVLFALLFSLYAVAVSLALSGVLAIFLSLFVLFQNLGAAMMLFGSGLMVAGLATLIFLPTLQLSRWCIRKMTNWIGKIALRKRIASFTHER